MILKFFVNSRRSKRKEIDVFDREKIFIEEKLTPIVNNFPELKITLEHITTKFAVDFVNDCLKILKHQLLHII